MGKPLATALAGDGLDEAIASLLTFALVDREQILDERDPTISTDVIRLHRLVREIAASRREDDAREQLCRVLVQALADVYPRDVFEDPNTWPRARRLDAVALALVGSDGEPSDGAEISASYLLDRLASYRQAALAAYAPARPLYERALAIGEKALGPGHPDIANSLNHFALLLRAQGELPAARPLHERALGICERALGPDHPYTAASLNNLARLLMDQGEFGAARPLCERALAIRKKALGPSHPDTATSLDTLGQLLRVQGEFGAARPLCERALAIREKARGPDHPDTAISLNNLALLLQAEGDLARARPLFERARAIRERVLGPEHPDIAISLDNFAGLLRIPGRSGGGAAST